MKTLLNKAKQKVSGFTLVEVLIVMFVLGILAGGVTSFYSSSQAKARDAVRIKNVEAVFDAQQIYETDKASLAQSFEELRHLLSNNDITETEFANDSELSLEKTTYMGIVGETGSRFVISACGMKNGNHPAVGDTTTDPTGAYVMKHGNVGTITVKCYESGNNVLLASNIFEEKKVYIAGLCTGCTHNDGVDVSAATTAITFPTEVYEGQEVSMTLSGAVGEDGGTVHYRISSQSGLSFNKTYGIDEGETVTATITGTTGETVGFTVYAYTTGNESEISSKAATVLLSSGGTGELTSSQTITVPAGASSITVRGHGSAGTQEIEDNTNVNALFQGYSNYACYDWHDTSEKSYSQELSQIFALATYNQGVMSTSFVAPNGVSFGLSNNSLVFWGKCAGTWRFNIAGMLYSPAEKGQDTEISGNISHIFSGSPLGDASVPTTEEVLFTLPSSESDYTFDVDVPDGGMIEVSW